MNLAKNRWWLFCKLIMIYNELEKLKEREIKTKKSFKKLKRKKEK